MSTENQQEKIMEARATVAVLEAKGIDLIKFLEIYSAQDPITPEEQAEVCVLMERAVAQNMAPKPKEN